MRRNTLSSFTLLVIVSKAAPVYSVTIPTVPIGNPDNPADSEVMTIDGSTGYGSVGYRYRIGKYEVTNAQYVEFLNAVAASDPYELYDVRMGSSFLGGIVRTGSPGSFSYSVKLPAVRQGPGGSDYEYDRKPVSFVSWFDTLRFANWLHNGQLGPGSTEDGAYTIVRETTWPYNTQASARNPSARWWLPSEDEWYKAAYFDPRTGNYYDYPMGSDGVPDNNFPESDTGNSANFPGGDSRPMTDVGAYTLSASPYVTYDQGGNVWEWNEAAIDAGSRKLRGSSFAFGGPQLLRASFFSGWGEADSLVQIGFRIATVIPEPNAITLFGFGILPLGRRVRR
jgi:formylglycine-generating enzyme required for sulfatase activity